MRQKLRDLITGTTKLVVDKYDLWDGGAWAEVDVTECCNVGPITNAKHYPYCPKCGKRIII